MSYSIEVPLNNSIACNAMKKVKSVKIYREKPGSNKMVFVVKDLSTLKEEVRREIEKINEDLNDKYKSYKLISESIDSALKSCLVSIL